MAETFQSAKAKALKILGKAATIPSNKAMLETADDLFAAFAAYQKAQEDMEAKILSMQKALSNHKLTMKQFGEKLDDDDFGINPKDKEDAKKLKDAHDIFDGWVASKMTIIDADIDGLDELGKHLINYENTNRNALRACPETCCAI